jgi:hypothetical protein
MSESGAFLQKDDRADGGVDDGRSDVSAEVDAEPWKQPARLWAVDVQGHPVRGGHLFPEERPLEIAAELRNFLTLR